MFCAGDFKTDCDPDPTGTNCACDQEKDDKPGSTLMHVVAMTRALGEPKSQEGSQPELYRWTDNGNSWVDATFVGGKLKEWALTRPDVPAEDTPTGPSTLAR